MHWRNDFPIEIGSPGNDGRSAGYWRSGNSSPIRHLYQSPYDVMAFGNSDGDYEMIKWTTSVLGARFGLIVHHTDSEREYAYDRDSKFGRLDRAMNEASERGWIVVDMKKDWRTMFPPTP